MISFWSSCFYNFIGSQEIVVYENGYLEIIVKIFEKFKIYRERSIYFWKIEQRHCLSV